MNSIIFFHRFKNIQNYTEKEMDEQHNVIVKIKIKNKPQRKAIQKRQTQKYLKKKEKIGK